jgi:hypothetical protein
MNGSNEPFFAAVGRFTLTWAHLEFALDAAISIIHQRLGGRAVERDAPMHAGRKVKYLKRCLTRLTPLSRFRDETLPVLQAITAAVEFRNNIVHGAITEHPLGANEVTLVRLLHSSDGQHTPQPLKVSIALLDEATNHVTGLAEQAGMFANAAVGELRE